jgi:hypothetical protein
MSQPSLDRPGVVPLVGERTAAGVAQHVGVRQPRDGGCPLNHPSQWKDLKLPDGRDRVVRHGHGPQRAIQTGVGPVEVRRAKVRDRAEVTAEEKIRFTSSILPKWARRTKSLDALLPILYLRGVSTGDFRTIYERQTRSRACSRQFVIARCARRDRCRRQPRS